jgi:hypothetical protein
MNDPLATINDIFKGHGKACRVAFDVRTRHISDKRRRMIRYQLLHQFPDYIISLHSDHIRIAPPDRAGV